MMLSMRNVRSNPLEDDFQIISESSVLMKINMKDIGEERGFLHCHHCWNKTRLQRPNHQTSNLNVHINSTCNEDEQHWKKIKTPDCVPPPIPPKPPWLTLVTKNINGCNRRINDINDEEHIIYGKNVWMQRQNLLHKSSLGSDDIKFQKDFKDKEKDNLMQKLSNMNHELLYVKNELSRVGTSREIETYTIHDEEVEKITLLLYNIVYRLASTETALEKEDMTTNHRKQLDEKQIILRGQLEEAKNLQTLINRRTCKIIRLLKAYFNDEVAERFRNLLNKKIKIILKLRSMRSHICNDLI